MGNGLMWCGNTRFVALRDEYMTGYENVYAGRLGWNAELLELELLDRIGNIKVLPVPAKCR